MKGAATKVNRFDGLFSQIFFPYLQLFTQRMDVAVFQFATGGGVEIAINATCLAKGNMDVDTCHVPVSWLGRKYTIFFCFELSDS